MITFIGKQANSKRPAAPTYKIGSSTGEGHEKLGCFMDTMTKAPVTFKHPHSNLTIHILIIKYYVTSRILLLALLLYVEE